MGTKSKYSEVFDRAETAQDLRPREVDVTGDACPMTFVRTRLALDRLAAGGLLRVRLRGDEPRANVPRMAESLGHSVIEVAAEADGVTSVLIRKGPAPPAG